MKLVIINHTYLRIKEGGLDHTWQGIRWTTCAPIPLFPVVSLEYFIPASANCHGPPSLPPLTWDNTKQKTHDRSKYAYHQSPLWWMIEFYWGYLQEYEEWLRDNRITGGLEHAIQPAGSSTCWTVSFPGASVGLNLFQAAWLLSAFFRQLVWSQSSLQLGFLVWEGRSAFIVETPTESFRTSQVVYLPAQGASLQDEMFISPKKLLPNNIPITPGIQCHL